MADQEHEGHEEHLDTGFKVGEWNELIGEDIQYKVRREAAAAAYQNACLVVQ
jgi:hypothetical protein